MSQISIPFMFHVSMHTLCHSDTTRDKYYLRHAIKFDMYFIKFESIFMCLIPFDVSLYSGSNQYETSVRTETIMLEKRFLRDDKISKYRQIIAYTPTSICLSDDLNSHPLFLCVQVMFKKWNYCHDDRRR